MAIRNFPRQIEIALIEIEFLVADLSAIVDMRSLSEKLRELLAHLRAAVQALRLTLDIIDAAKELDENGLFTNR